MYPPQAAVYRSLDSGEAYACPNESNVNNVSLPTKHAKKNHNLDKQNGAEKEVVEPPKLALQ
jgi:hypothetical protein